MMMITRILVYLVIASFYQCTLSHHLRHHNNAGNLQILSDISEDIASQKNRRSVEPEYYNRNSSDSDKDKIPYSYKKLDKMMKKAILQIILGDLHPADMLLLKALNYTMEEVMAIREHELSKAKEEEQFETRKKKQKEQELLSAKYQTAIHHRSSLHQRKKTNRESNFETYNSQAVYDYENGPTAIATSSSKLDYEESMVTNDKNKVSSITEESFRQNFDRAMEPHVVFKIRYDDSEFDSGSDEKSRITLKNHRVKTILKIDKAKSGAMNFRISETNNECTSTADTAASAAAAAATVVLDTNYELDGSVGSSKHFEDYSRQTIFDYENLVHNEKLNGDEGANDIKDRPVVMKKRERDFVSHEKSKTTLNSSRLEYMEQRNESATTVNSIKNEKSEGEKATTVRMRTSEYEGLEWVGGDVYRVMPEAMEALLNYEDEAAMSTATTDYEIRGGDEENLRQTSYLSLSDLMNDTFEYQNDESSIYASNETSAENQNLTSYHRLTLAQRRDQGQKAIEDIKLRVLAMTGRFNLTSSNNQVQRERLTMFSPVCQMPRNADAEAWVDPFSMNMHFQLNLTSGEHVLAAKLRLFKLPQDTFTLPSSSTYEEEEEDEKKIRVSVYFYTKSLKKHRAKKRLMDSIVTPLTSQGSHLALDVRQGLRFWRPNAQHGHTSNSNHGLVVQLEDQDGRPLKPAMYIQEPSCQSSSADSETDEKTSTSLPFSSEPVLVTFAS
ncbi:PREDICTED: uncharacterized protein LOC105360234 isoform X2 [Ceratosolen solmsi marchali]|uniref:Uncharacterized protein LOC105360234 isoform X2 n=1 Tax=Ceratosolen solmsi marchali TaxID=326594 RepID=A0AAJ6VMW9_9HYME|nr:PREDICTED: uncharacterized protein LOC105360234 isoform X2 [Ceratosolen solmsi marchali]